MGRASNLTAARRAQAGQLTAGLRKTREQQLREFADEKEKDPGLQAQAEASMADARLAEIHAADYPGQRERLRRAGWVQAYLVPLGAGGWANGPLNLQMIHGLHLEEEGSRWSHMSITFHRGNALPGWSLLRDTHRLLYPDLCGVQVIAPEDRHVNIAEVVHAWTRLDGPTVPDFGKYGTV